MTAAQPTPRLSDGTKQPLSQRPPSNPFNRGSPSPVFNTLNRASPSPAFPFIPGGASPALSAFHAGTVDPGPPASPRLAIFNGNVIPSSPILQLNGGVLPPSPLLSHFNVGAGPPSPRLPVFTGGTSSPVFPGFMYGPPPV